MPIIQSKLELFEPNDLVSILLAATKPMVKKRELKRQLFNTCLQSMQLIAETIQLMESSNKNDPEQDSDKQQLRLNYYEVFKVAGQAILKDEMQR